MKIEFSDKSYIEINKSNEENKIDIIISAKDYSNNLKKITNSCTISLEDFKKLIEEFI